MPTGVYTHKAPTLEWLIDAISKHGDSNNCLLWPYGKTIHGYGVTSFNGKRSSTHRLAFYLANGYWAPVETAHSCDTPACFNPKHLFAATHRENMEDRAKKLRCKGKLTAELVRKIRAEYIPYNRTFSARALARKYGLTHNNMWLVVTKRMWKHLSDDPS